jgi:porphobilinogen deaminase
MALRLGTRESALRLAHAEWVAHRLQAAHTAVRIVPVRGPGPAGSALRDAPAVGGLDVAVPFAKDLPTMTATESLNPLQAVGAERAVLVTMAAGRSAPVGALAQVVEDLYVEDLDEDGGVVLRLSVRGISAAAGDSLLRGCATVASSALGELTDAEKLGRRVGAELLDPGAGARDVFPALPGPVVA